MQATQKSAVPAQLPNVAARQGLVQWAGEKFGVDAGKVFPILKSTCFRADKEGREATDAEVAALMIVAREHGLNPFLKEIYAFPDKKGGIVPVVGIDGWIRITNEHPEFDGVEFVYEKEDGPPAWIECVMYRKDRSKPIRVREFFAECKRDTPPWKSHGARMLRHRAFIQCARVAFGFAGIFDPDEADGIIEGQVIEQAHPQTAQPPRGAAALRAAVVDDGINLEQPNNAAPPVSPPGDASAQTVTPSRPADAAPKKEPGTAAVLEKILKGFKASKNAEMLALVRDEANLYEWTEADTETIDVAYSKRQDALKGA